MFQLSADFEQQTLDTFVSINSFKDSLFSNGPFESNVGKTVRACSRLMRVRVYRNLNKPAFYSILAQSGPDKGKVIGYAKSILLENCEFIVSAAGHKRANASRTRNVHAYLQGTIVDASNTLQSLDSAISTVTYNPFFLDTFFERDSKVPRINGCIQAILQGSNVHVLE